MFASNAGERCPPSKAVVANASCNPSTIAMSSDVEGLKPIHERAAHCPGEDLQAAMPAVVVKHVDGARRIAGHDDALARDLQRCHRLRDVVHQSDADPAVREQGALLEVEEPFGRIRFCRQTPRPFNGALDGIRVGIPGAEDVGVSIRAPAKGATGVQPSLPLRGGVSIRAPAKGATPARYLFEKERKTEPLVRTRLPRDTNKSSKGICLDDYIVESNG